jgi:hypothetical protein
VIRIILAGEGKNELGGFAVEAAFRDEEPEPGVLETLLRQVRPEGFRVVYAILWKMRCAHALRGRRLAACIAGLGIIQAPRTGMTTSLASGAIVEILPVLTCEPMPVSILHGHARNVPKRVRALMTWITQLLEPHLE